MKHLPSQVHPAETGKTVEQPEGLLWCRARVGDQFSGFRVYMALGICLYWEAGMLEPAGGMATRWGERWMGGGCIISLFLTLVSKQKTLSFVLLKIQDYFEQRKQIKNGHHNILLISFKKLIRLQRHSTERVHGPLPWMDAENPHVNQLVIAESVWEAGTCLKQKTNIPALDLCTMHSLSIYSFPHV